MPVVIQDSRHKAVWDWLMTCPHIGDLFFSASRAIDGATQMFPSEEKIADYIDGSRKIQYVCALTRFMPYTTDPNDEANMTYLVDFEKIGDWIEDQLADGNIPVFPDGYMITDISVLPNQSGWIVAQDMTQAKFMIQFNIEYIREAWARTTSADDSGSTKNDI